MFPMYHQNPPVLQLANMLTPPDSHTGTGPAEAVYSSERAIHFCDKTFQCMWDGDVPGIHCNEEFFGHELSAHLKEHGIQGADKLRFSCRWNSCGLELNRESFTRHMKEKHLQINYACDICNQTFTREYNLIAHCRKSHMRCLKWSVKMG